MRILPRAILAIILFGYCVSVAAVENSLDFRGLKEVYSVEEQGFSFTASGNIVRTDNKVQMQSAIPLVALPRRAKVVKAFLYWSGEVLSVSSADTSVDLILPNGKPRKVYADDVRSSIQGGLLYSCRADVTKHVHSNGLYQIKELDLDPIRGTTGVSGSWALVVVYKLPGFSKSKVTVYDNLNGGNSVVEGGEIRTRVGPAVIVEERPKDALFYLKKGDECFSTGNYVRSFASYLAAIAKSPIFSVSYILEVRKNRLFAAVETGMHLVRPFLVRLNSILAGFFIGYTSVLNLIYLLLTVIAAYVAKRYLDENRGIPYEEYVRNNRMLPVSILISAYNEEHAIGRTLSSLLRLKYPEYEIIVINDGSKDGTLDVLRREYDLREAEPVFASALPTHSINKVYRSGKFPILRVIDKKNSGKADSLNAGINLSRCPLFCTIDADTILEEDALFQLALPVLKNPEEVVSTTGMVRLRNGCEVKEGVIVKRGLPDSFLAIIQVLEYIRAYSIGRIGWNLFNSHMIVSGAFSLYQKELVIRLGGYHRYAIGEDVELNMRIHRALLEAGRRYRIIYVLTARCLTQAPVDFKSLSRQRNRWQQGLITTIRLNTRVLFNRRYHHLGMFTVPFYALLEMPAPILEFFGYVIMPIFALFGMVSVKYMLILLGLVFVYGSGLSYLALILDERFFKFYGKESYRKLSWCLFLENFGFHQLTVIWRMRGIVDYLKGVHVRGMGWKSPQRLEVAHSV